MTVYEIQEGILECLDADGELIDQERFNELNIALEDKIEGLALWVKNLESEAVAIKAEEESLKDRRQRKEQRAKNLKEYIQFILGGNKFETSKVAITYRKSESVEIEPFAEIPEDYRVVKETITADKKALKEALKAGEEFEGISLVTKQNMQLK